jgi:excisionase family DNA binding protein
VSGLFEPLRFEVSLPPEALEAIAARVAELVAASLTTAALAESEPFLTVEHAAAYIDGKPHRVRDLLTEGRLTRYKDGARTLVSRNELDAHLRGELVGPVAQRLPSGCPRGSQAALVGRLRRDRRSRG